MEIDICPRWLLAKLGVSPERQIHFALLFSAAIVLVSAPLIGRIPHVCLMQALLGVPCPGCGVLHSMTALGRWHWASAWHSNPAGIAVAAMFAFQLVARTIAIAAAGAAGVVTRISRLYSYAVLGSLLLVWGIRLTIGGMHGSYFLPKM